MITYHLLCTAGLRAGGRSAAGGAADGGVLAARRGALHRRDQGRPHAQPGHHVQLQVWCGHKRTALVCLEGIEGKAGLLGELLQ